MQRSKQGRIKDDAKAEYKPFKIPTQFTVENLRKELGEDGKNYSDEELEIIQAGFNFLHEICYQTWVNQRTKANTLTLIKNEESNIIYPSEYRRAS